MHCLSNEIKERVYVERKAFSTFDLESADGGEGVSMINSQQTALIKKDIRAVTSNKRLFSVILIVPLFMTVVLPAIFIAIAGRADINSSDIQDMVTAFGIPEHIFGTDLREFIIRMIMNDVIPLFFLMIPILTSTTMAASSFIGEKEKRTLETLLYSPLSIKQIFDAKVVASMVLSLLVSLGSFVLMILVTQSLVWIFIGRFISMGWNWLILLLLVSPGMSLIAIAFIVRGSAKAQSVEESQQRSAFLVIPILLLIIMQFSGLQIVSVWVMLVGGLICLISGYLFARRISLRFSYEKLLL